MKEFEHAYNVLIKVVEEGLPFNIAIRSSLKEEKNKYTGDFKSSISAVSGCALRHYFVFKEIVSRHYGEIEEKEFLLLYYLFSYFALQHHLRATTGLISAALIMLGTDKKLLQINSLKKQWMPYRLNQKEKKPRKERKLSESLRAQV
jgi:hypothetical protein